MAVSSNELLDPSAAQNIVWRGAMQNSMCFCVQPATPCSHPPARCWNSVRESRELRAWPNSWNSVSTCKMGGGRGRGQEILAPNSGWCGASAA